MLRKQYIGGCNRCANVHLNALVLWQLIPYSKGAKKGTHSWYCQVFIIVIIKYSKPISFTLGLIITSCVKFTYIYVSMGSFQQNPCNTRVNRGLGCLVWCTWNKKFIVGLCKKEMLAIFYCTKHVSNEWLQPDNSKIRIGWATQERPLLKGYTIHEGILHGS